MTAADDKRKRDAYEQECRDFRMCFGNPAGERVLFYLANFCSAGISSVHVTSENSPVDINRTLVNEGRRQAFLEIQKRLSLTPDQLFAIATGRTYRAEGEQNE